MSACVGGILRHCALTAHVESSPLTLEPWCYLGTIRKAKAFRMVSRTHGDVILGVLTPSRSFDSEYNSGCQNTGTHRLSALPLLSWPSTGYA